MDKYPKTHLEANEDSPLETEKQTGTGVVPTGYREKGRQGEDREYEANWVYRESALCDFVSWACITSRKIGSEAKRWQSSTFHFVRLCRGRTEFEAMTPAEFFKAVPWHSTDFNEDEISTAVIEFGKVKTAAGQDPLISALWLAEELPVMESGRFSNMKSFHLFLSLAYHLQRLQGDNPVYFPCHRVAALLGVTPMIISQYRQTAKIFGYLKEIAPHNKKKATRFRVNLDIFPRIKDVH